MVEASPAAPRRCTVCGKAADPRFRPFCSARCKQVDLGRWLAGDYVIPGDPPEGGPEDDPDKDKAGPAG